MSKVVLAAFEDLNNIRTTNNDNEATNLSFSKKGSNHSNNNTIKRRIILTAGITTSERSLDELLNDNLSLAGQEKEDNDASTGMTGNISIADTLNTIDDSSSSIITPKASPSSMGSDNNNNNENTATINHHNDNNALKGKPKAKVGVSFCVEDKLRTVYEIERLYHSSDGNNNNNNIWLTDADMTRIDISNSAIAMKINRGYFIETENEQTRRGLETYIESNLKAICYTRRNTINAVLGEQHRQKKLGIGADPELIAELYRTAGGSLKCQQIAHQTGVQDYKDTSGINAEEKDSLIAEKISLIGKLKRATKKLMCFGQKKR